MGSCFYIGGINVGHNVMTRKKNVAPETPPVGNSWWSASRSYLVKQAVRLCERVGDGQVEEVGEVFQSQPLSLQLPGSSGQLLQRCVCALRSQPANPEARPGDLVAHLDVWPRRSCDVLIFSVSRQTRSWTFMAKGGKKKPSLKQLLLNCQS